MIRILHVLGGLERGGAETCYMPRAVWKTCRDRFEVSIINVQMRAAIGY